MVADANGLELAYVHAPGEHPGVNATGLTLEEALCACPATGSGLPCNHGHERPTARTTNAGVRKDIKGRPFVRNYGGFRISPPRSRVPLAGPPDRPGGSVRSFRRCKPVQRAVTVSSRPQDRLAIGGISVYRATP